METTNFFKLNGKPIPAPARGLEFILTNFVTGGRNANGTFVGEKIGRTQYKINALEWRAVSQEVVSFILEACESFTFNIEFVDPMTGKFKKLKMYCGDRTVKPYFYNHKVETDEALNGEDRILMYESVKVNIIDVGEISDGGGIESARY